jgi:hypothetical protein
MPPPEAARSVVRVGDGRGFVVEGNDENRYIVTAAHCLPHLPTACSFASASDVTFKDLLGPPQSTAPTIWAQCLFADPVGDIAVLGAPDGQILGDQCNAYEDFVSEAVPLSLRRVRDEEPGWLFALDGQHWFRCKVEGIQHRLWVADATEPIRGGMSGSPILGDDGKALAVCCASAGSGDRELEDDGEGGPNPGVANLPDWFLEKLNPTDTERPSEREP